MERTLGDLFKTGSHDCEFLKSALLAVRKCAVRTVEILLDAAAEDKTGVVWKN